MARSDMTGVVMSVATGKGNRAGKWLGGGSPLEAVMTGTPSRTARASVARRGLKEAGGKVPARGTRTAYEAAGGWARGHEDLKPDSHSDRPAVDAAGMWDESHAPYPGRSGSLPLRLGPPRGGPMGSQKSAEAVVVAGAPRRRAERSGRSRCRAFDGRWRRRDDG